MAERLPRYRGDIDIWIVLLPHRLDFWIRIFLCGVEFACFSLCLDGFPLRSTVFPINTRHNRSILQQGILSTLRSCPLPTRRPRMGKEDKCCCTLTHKNLYLYFFTLMKNKWSSNNSVTQLFSLSSTRFHAARRMFIAFTYFSQGQGRASCRLVRKAVQCLF